MSNRYKKQWDKVKAAKNGDIERELNRPKQIEQGIKNTKESNEYMDKMYPNRRENYKQEKEILSVQVNALELKYKEVIENLKQKLLNEAASSNISQAVLTFKDDLKLANSINTKLVELKKVKQESSNQDLLNMIIEISKQYPEILLAIPVDLYKYVKKLPINELNGKQIISLDNRISAKKPELYSMPSFIKNYSKYMPSQLNTLTNISDIICNLQIEASGYKKLNSSMKKQIESNQKLGKLLTSAPQVIYFLNGNEIKAAYEQSARSLGCAIVACPDILNKFKPTFFDLFSTKMLFSNLNETKADLIEVFKNIDLSKHPKLEKYLTITKFTPYKSDDDILSV